MGTNQSNIIQDEAPEKVPTKIPRLYMSVVRKRTLKISVYDYPEHLNPFREEEEIERRAAQAALEGRTSRCHLLPMSPYSTLSRSPKPRLDLSPTSSGASTPVNGTLRRRMKRRAPLPPPLSGGTTPTSASPACTLRSRPATPPPAESSLKQCDSPEDEPKLPSDFQEPAAPTSQAETMDPVETKIATVPIVNGEVAGLNNGVMASMQDEPREAEADASVCAVESDAERNTLTAIPREPHPPDDEETPSPVDTLVHADIQTDSAEIKDTNTTLVSDIDPTEIPPQTDVPSTITQEAKEEIERLNNTEKLAEKTIEINNIDVENNNSKNILIETVNYKTDGNEINPKSNLVEVEDKIEKVEESQIEIDENKDDIQKISENNIKTTTDEAFQDNSIEESKNIKNCVDEKREKILTPSEERELPYIDQDSTSKSELTQNDTKTISNGHSHSLEDEVKHNGHEETIVTDNETTELAPSPLPRRSKSPNSTSQKEDLSPSRKFTSPNKPSQDKYAKQVSHYEIKITDITDV